MKATHFGAGNIGRGFIGQVLHDNNFEITFIDTNQQLIEQINSDEGYLIELLDDKKTEIWIDGVSAIDSQAEEKVLTSLVSSDLITTSVGASNLKYIAPILKKALLIKSNHKEYIDILANENAINASDLLKNEIKKICSEKEWQSITKVSYFVNTAIDRQSLSKFDGKSYIAVVEPYYEWVIEERALNPKRNYNLKNVTFVDDMRSFVERKLFIVNAEHAAFAYLGALLGMQTIQEAIHNEDCYLLVEKFMNENKQYFINKYGMSESELSQFINKTIERHGNSAILDDINRVGRSPIRKLARNDRLVGPVMALESLGLKNSTGKTIIAAAYLYKNPEDSEANEIQKMILSKGIEETIKYVSELPESVVQEIATIYSQVKQNKYIIFQL
jgi:mannitol-1-phosphate 5-dehydrogenase